MHAEITRLHCYDHEPLPEVACHGRTLEIGIDGDGPAVSIQFGTPARLMEFAAKLFREAARLEAKTARCELETAS